MPVGPPWSPFSYVIWELIWWDSHLSVTTLGGLIPKLEQMGFNIFYLFFLLFFLEFYYYHNFKYTYSVFFLYLLIIYNDFISSTCSFFHWYAMVLFPYMLQWLTDTRLLTSTSYIQFPKFVCTCFKEWGKRYMCYLTLKILSIISQLVFFHRKI